MMQFTVSKSMKWLQRERDSKTIRLGNVSLFREVSRILETK